MLKIEKFVTPSPAQWMIVLEGMRNAKNSWDRMDSYITHIEDVETLETADYAFFMGDKDHELAMSLAKGGSVHGKYRRQLPVHVTLTAPLYWWKEFETYRVGVAPNPSDIECNSCSTMHKIDAKEFTLEDFSCENLLVADSMYVLGDVIDRLNHYRELFKETGERVYWDQLIQLLPSSYNQKRTLCVNYEVLAHMWADRHAHKLQEWHTLCDWIESLPYSEIMVPNKNGHEFMEKHLFVPDDRPMGGFKDI